MATSGKPALSTRSQLELAISAYLNSRMDANDQVIILREDFSSVSRRLAGSIMPLFREPLAALKAAASRPPTAKPTRLVAAISAATTVTPARPSSAPPVATSSPPVVVNVGMTPVPLSSGTHATQPAAPRSSAKGPSPRRPRLSENLRAARKAAHACFCCGSTHHVVKACPHSRLGPNKVKQVASQTTSRKGTGKPPVEPARPRTPTPEPVRSPSPVYQAPSPPPPVVRKRAKKVKVAKKVLPPNDSPYCGKGKCLAAVCKNTDPAGPDAWKCGRICQEGCDKPICRCDQS